MNKTLLCLAATVIFSLAPNAARAYDESVHHAILQVLALNNGYSPQAAAMISDASQSLDDLDQLTAFSLSKLTAETKDTLTNLTDDTIAGKVNTVGQRAVQLDHMCTGQLFHALTEHRDLVERMHIDRINSLLRDANLDPAKPDPAKQSLAMLYLGEYLHFLSDSVVHPTNPLLGHAKEFDAPDRPEDDPAKLEIAMRLMKEKLDQFAKGQVQPTTWRPTADAKATVPVPAETTVLDGVEHRLATTVVTNIFKPTFGQEAVEASKEAKADVWHVFDDERERRLEVTLDKFVRGNHEDFQRIQVQMSGENLAGRTADTGFQAHQTIQLDGYGDPFSNDDNLARFGKVRSIENLGSFFNAAEVPELRAERRREIATAGLLTFRDEARAAAAALLPPDDESASRRWALPSSPGGVALNPRLSFPENLGAIQQITLDQRGVAIVCAAGTYPVESLNPQTFATILRTVCGGEIPYITIGSERSEREGYAKVTYAPSMRGTREGAALYRADIQFKAIFAHYPFGEGYRLNTPGDELAGGYPGPGGESTRLWITSSDIRLALDAAGTLRADRHGMKIFGETTLMRQVVRDEAMDRYVQKLTDHWDDIAAQVPAFRAVQQMALATALAFWVREHRIAVDPIIWTIPEKGDSTPDYAPLVTCISQAGGIAGGVSLTPEDRDSNQGRLFFGQIARMIDEQEQQSGSSQGPRMIIAAIAVAASLLIVMMSAGIVWVVLRTSSMDERPPGYWQTLWTWVGILAIQAFLAMIAAPFLNGLSLSQFDKDFLAFAVTIIASPVIFFARIKPAKRYGSKNTLTKRAFVLSLLTPLVSGVCGIGAAIVTAVHFGTVPSPALERVLTTELAPIDALQAATFTAMQTPDDAVRLLPWTHSMLMGQAPQFEHHTIAADSPTSPTLEMKDDPASPFRGGQLRRTAWPANMPVNPDAVHYSTDGQPPDSFGQ